MPPFCCHIEDLARVPGVTERMPREWERSSALTRFSVEAFDERTFAAYLRDEWRVLPRGAGRHQIRVSTAGFSTEQEIDRLVAGGRAFLARSEPVVEVASRKNDGCRFGDEVC